MMTMMMMFLQQRPEIIKPSLIERNDDKMLRSNTPENTTFTAKEAF
jgi:hypothetical protein